MQYGDVGRWFKFVFSDKKKCIQTKITRGHTERQAKGAKRFEESLKAATALIQLQEAKGSISFKDNSDYLEEERQLDQHETSTAISQVSIGFG